MDEAQEKLEAMEREKASMIKHYLGLQDQADALNEEIYRACCSIESLNARIDALKADLHRAALKGAPANGSSKKK